MIAKPKKSLGQNFLKDKNILNKIVSIGNLSKKDIVLEIGPGTGNLTEKIIEQNPQEIYVVEKDTNLSVLLKKKFGSKINIINKDILECYNKFKFDKKKLNNSIIVDKKNFQVVNVFLFFSNYLIIFLAQKDN